MPHLTMQGNPVFRWASFAMAKIGQQALDAAGITLDDLDVFVPHQANMRIIDAMARSMKLPEHGADRPRRRRPGQHLGRLGPARARPDDGRGRGPQSGDTALLIAFGAGLSYAAQVVTVP